jgi:hypothetical protein
MVYLSSPIHILQGPLPLFALLSLIKTVLTISVTTSIALLKPHPRSTFEKPYPVLLFPLSQVVSLESTIKYSTMSSIPVCARTLTLNLSLLQVRMV